MFFGGAGLFHTPFLFHHFFFNPFFFHFLPFWNWWWI